MTDQLTAPPATAAYVTEALNPAVTAPAQAAPVTAPATADEIDWTAKWIGRPNPREWPKLGQQNPAPLLRHSFHLDKRVADASLSIVGLGYYEAWINGRRVGDQVLDPPPSVFDKTAFFRTFNVGDSLRKGANAICVTLGRGFFCTPAAAPSPFDLASAPWRQEPRLLAQLDITFTDGTTQRVGTDSGWKIADGPTRDALYYGEHYDARQAKPGWTSATFDDSSWESAPEQPAPTQHVVPTDTPPVKVTDTLEPIEVTTSETGSKVYDFGRVTAGWARITVAGAAGTVVTLTYGEQLDDDGTVHRPDGYGTETHVDSYTLAATASQTWEPSFTRHGFRYVEVSSSGPTSSFAIQARVAHTELRSTGRFHAGNALLNAIHANQRASLLGNMWGLPTDTPWRDRQGWTADAYLYLDSAALNFDVERFYSSWLRTFRDSQKSDGSLPVIVPNAGGFPLYNDPSWSGTYILAVWGLYQHYGNDALLRDNYEAMSRWMDLMQTSLAGTRGLYAAFSFGDWASPGSEKSDTGLFSPEGSELTANADLYHEARTLARIADQLGRRQDAARYDTMADGIAGAFNAKFLDPEAGLYRTTVKADYRQTSNVVALAYGLVPEEHEKAVVNNLVKDINDRGTHLNTGAIGTKLLLPVLTEHGHADLAYRLATQTDYPSWGAWVKNGATTSWETWSNCSKDLSLNHAFLGTIDEWLYRYLTGIQAAAPGYSTVLIAPVVPVGLHDASATVTTPHGPITSSWHHEAGRLTLTITVPPMTPAQIRIPLPDGATSVTDGNGTTQIGKTGDSISYSVTGGTHVFQTS